MRTLSSKEKSPKLDQTQDIHTQNMGRALQPPDEQSQNSKTTFGATIEREHSTDGTDSKRLTM